MLDKRARGYFSKRNAKTVDAAARRGFFRLMLSIANQLVQMRKRKGLTQHELAKRLNTSQSTVALWETPVYTGYSIKKLHSIATELGFDLKLEFIPKGQDVEKYFEASKPPWTVNRKWKAQPGRTAITALSTSVVKQDLIKSFNRES